MYTRLEKSTLFQKLKTFVSVSLPPICSIIELTISPYLTYFEVNQNAYSLESLLEYDISRREFNIFPLRDLSLISIYGSSEIFLTDMIFSVVKFVVVLGN